MKIIRKPIFQIIVLFIIFRVFLGLWMWGVRQVFPINPVSIHLGMYMGTALETNPWLEPWQRWDTPHYQAIAEYGYSAFPNALFTPPLYPFLMYFVAVVTTSGSLASGLFISGISFLICLLLIFQVARLELENEVDALHTTTFMACFPTSFFLAAAYSESLFLLGAILSLYSARKARWVAAGLWGALAAMTRTPGPFLVFPLAFAAWQAGRAGQWRAWLAPLITGLGAGLYPAYVWLVLHQPPTSILDALNARGGKLALPGLNVFEAANRILHGQLVAENLVELIFTILFIVLTIFVWKKLPRIYGVYSLTLMLLFLTRIGYPQPLVSMARYVLEIFPAFLILAIWGRNVWARRLILYLSWLGLLFFSAQFAIWGWVG